MADIFRNALFCGRLVLNFFLRQMPILIYKKIGETPLEAIKRLVIENPSLKNEKLSYAGRLDPLAEGLLLILQGNECSEENRKKFLGLEKEYEVEVLFGFSTDSYDLLGILDNIGTLNSTDLVPKIEKIIPEYVGANHGLKYPPFSSKTINGKSLFELAKSKATPRELPLIMGEIGGLEIISSKLITKAELEEYIQKVISLVKGNFRQSETLEKWSTTLDTFPDLSTWPIVRFKVSCESGVYMRSLAESMGRRLQAFALAFSIKRTKIGGFRLEKMA